MFVKKVLDNRLGCIKINSEMVRESFSDCLAVVKSVASLKRNSLETSPVVQWLRLLTFYCRGPGFDPLVVELDPVCCVHGQK